MILRTFISWLGFSVLSSLSHAQDHSCQFLLQVASDAYPVKSHAYVMLCNNDRISGFRYIASDRTHHEFNISDMFRGVTLMQKFSVPVVGLRLDPDFTIDQGGNVTLSFLKNAVWRSYGEYKFSLKVEDNVYWVVDCHSGATINTLHLNGQFLWGRAIGTRNVSASWQDAIDQLSFHSLDLNEAPLDHS